MSYPINRQRLAETFTTLCEISSPSRSERRISSHLQQLFRDLGAEAIIEDQSMEQTGSSCGNLLIRFRGNRPDLEPIFFSCHMDTVQPGDGVEVVRKGDIFTSRGETILGSDDKSGIAAIIELMTLLQEQQADHGQLEIVLTTCEEVGLLGAKSLDYSQIQASYGYALDSSGIDSVIIGAPAANKFKIEITGAAAHAGLHPEAGISAIQIAAQAITQVQLGRLDDESTANFGIIQGGIATNIIPDLVVIQGEVRSHSAEKLSSYTAKIESTFRQVVADWPSPVGDDELRPTVTIETMAEYPAMRLEHQSPVVSRIRRAGEKTGKNLRFLVAGGGSDANILNGYGLPTAIVATGMDKVHTTEEQLDLNHLVSLTELIYTIATSP